MSLHPVIALRGVRVHNLRGIDVAFPLSQITAVTGVSGAGKSSLVFDTLFAEAQRRYLQSFSVAIRQHLERFDAPDAEWIGDMPAAVAVRRHAGALRRATVGSLTEISDFLQLLLTRAGTPHCPHCRHPVQPARVADVLAAVQSLPERRRITIAFPSRPEPDQSDSEWAAALREDGFVRLQVGNRPFRLDEPAPLRWPSEGPVWVLVDRLEVGKVSADRLRDSLETAFSRGRDRLALLTDDGEQLFDRRWHCPRCDVPCPEPLPHSLVCDDAGRWSAQALSIQLRGATIADLSTMTAHALLGFLSQVPPRGDIDLLLIQLRRRLDFLMEVELGHLSLLRSAATLSGGERKRLDLCAAWSNNLVGALYLLDEPSAGLHPRDLGKVLHQIRRLRAAGNAVIMIEHHPDFIRAADHVIDLGPGAGEEGGRVVAQGAPGDIAACAESVTGEFLSGRAAIAAPTQRRKPEHWLQLRGASLHNLKELEVAVPLGVLCVVTGVSGAGKSTLVEDILVPLLQRDRVTQGAAAPPPGASVQGAGQLSAVLVMDQEPLPRSARSNPATYLKLLDDIRELFAETADAKIRGLDAGHFSFNQPGGRCDVCSGQGTLAVDMQFLADVVMTCPECSGHRFQKEVLNVNVRSLSIADVLNLTVREAFRFFRAQSGLQRKLKWLLDVGLEYLRLGQPTDTLSGGECQRLKLAGRLAASRKPRSLFVLLEPSAGLHPADTQRLLDCCDRLVQTGHSVLVIEHNLDVIQWADYIIDLGPGAGPDGGRVVAQGTPEAVAQVAESHTGQFLRQVVGTAAAKC